MNQWPKMLSRITSTCLLWFNTKLRWLISVHSIKIWLYLALSKIFAWLKMNLVKVIFHKVVNQRILNGCKVKRSWLHLFLPYNLMRVTVFRLRKMILNSRKKIVRVYQKNAINIWNSVLNRWYTNTISLQLLFIQI